MKTLNLTQGTPEWHQHRANHFNASDAPAMLGCSPYKTRAQLLREMAAGSAPDIDPATQRIFDNGHRFEALARPLAEQIIGEELFPVTGSEGRLSASFDGLTMMENLAFEHKSLNDDLRAVMTESCTGADLPKHYRVQMEQQHMVSGCEAVLFIASKWDGNDQLIEERHCWYHPDAALRDEIMQGWAQFAEDLAGYQHTEVAPAAVGRAPDALPALRIEVTGMVTASNLEAFKAGAAMMFSRINRNLQTDQDFADAEKTIKHCKEVEDNIESAKRHALSQTASIDELYRALDSVSAEARTVRLELDKLVKARKENIRVEIHQEAQFALMAHIDMIDARLSPLHLPAIKSDFLGAMKGKKTVQSLRDACDSELARCKIEASRIADLIGTNQKSLYELGRNHIFLFNDAQQLVLKANDDLVAVIKSRIADHEAAESAKLEAERERIRQEEAEKLRKEADAKKADEAQEESIAAVGIVAAQSSAKEATQAGIPLPKENDHAASAMTTAAPTIKRPSDKQIIFAVATQFNTDFYTACQWIKELDFSEIRGEE